MEVVVIIVLAIVFAGGGKARPSTPGPGGVPKGRQAVIDAGTSFRLSGAWLNWLQWVALGESGWDAAQHNDSRGERARARDGYQRLRDAGRWPCGPQGNAIGSGGWYGQLYPYTIVFGHALGYGCDPFVIWRDPLASTHVHLRQVRGTIASYLRRLPPAQQTYLHLRALYGNPSRVGAPGAIDSPQRRARYSATLRRAGIDPAFLDVHVQDLPEGL